MPAYTAPAPRPRRSKLSTAPVARNTIIVSSVTSLKRGRARAESPPGLPSRNSTAVQPRKAIAASACSHRRTTSNGSASAGGAGTLELGQKLVQVGGGQRVPLAHQPTVGGDEVGFGHAAHAVQDGDRAGVP